MIVEDIISTSHNNDIQKYKKFKYYLKLESIFENLSEKRNS